VTRFDRREKETDMSVRFGGWVLLAVAVLGIGAPVRAADEPKVVKLPAPAGQSVVAGGGRYLVLHLPPAKQIAVFDVKDGKVAKSLPAPEDDIALAGGLDYVFIVRKSNNTMQRWSLATFEKEATVRLPVDGAFETAHMGADSNGPMLLAPRGAGLEGAGVTLLNPITVRPVPTTGYLPLATPETVRVSPDGQVFSWKTAGVQQTAVLRFADGKFVLKISPAGVYDLQPGPGGRFFYGSSHVYDDEIRPVHPRPAVPARNWVTSATQGPFFFEWERPVGRPMAAPPGFSKVHVFFEGQFKPVATIGNLDRHETSTALPRVIPRYGRMILFGKNKDELILHPFDLDALLAKSEDDYLAVVSDPPHETLAGRTFEYAPVVKSKKGGVKVSLDAGPDGMKLSADGKLTWDVPAAMVKQDAVVILSVSDASGQDLFHTFRITVVAPTAEKP
jgi:hypothetical protein